MLKFINGVYSEIAINDVPNIIKEIEEPEIVLKRRFRKNSLRYYNIECGFDIETTSTYIDGNKTAWMYEWTLGIKNTIIIGRTWKEFVNTINMLQNIYSNAIWVIYVHNLSFEFQFMREYLPIDDVFASEARTVLYARSNNIEFRDSYILSGYSLGKLAENLLTHKIEKLKGDLDYSLIRTSDTTLTKEELGYCVNDVLIILYYINEQITEFGNIVKIPMTNTGRVRNHCREKCLFITKKDGKKGRNHDYMNLMKSEYMTADLYKMARLAFRGGFTHASITNVFKLLTKVGSFDLTSAYPAMMVSKMFPVGSPEQLEKCSLKQWDYGCSKYSMLGCVKFKGLRTKEDVYDNYISWIPAKMTATGLGQLNNNRVTSADTLNMIITNIDWWVITRTYEWDEVEFYNIYIWKNGRLPKELVDCILAFYEAKTTLKGIPEKTLEYQNGKGKLNGIYGMIVQDPLKDSNIYDDGTWSTQAINLDEAIERYNNSPSRFTYYVQGLWVTAYCRQAVWKAILEVGEDYVYTDTDSVKMLNPEKHVKWFEDYNKEIKDEMFKAMDYYGFSYDRVMPKTIKGESKLLGVFDFEGIYDEFKTLGAKRYMTRTGEKYELTCSGVVKEAVSYIVEQGGFSAFTETFKIPPEHTGKLSHTYIDIPFNDPVMDYQGNITTIDSLSSIHLEPVGYEMNPDNEWIEWLFTI